MVTFFAYLVSTPTTLQPIAINLPPPVDREGIPRQP